MRIKIATKYHCIIIKFPSNWEKPTVAATSRQDENRVVPVPGGACGHRPSERQRGGSPGRCRHTLTAAALLLGPSPRGQSSAQEGQMFKQLIIGQWAPHHAHCEQHTKANSN